MQSIPDLIYSIWKNDGKRSYLGASVVGQPCDRRLWMSFRWCLKPNFDGRLLRLFNRGHREEDVFIWELSKICSGAVMATDPETGKQFEFTAFGGHFQCHLDGVAFGVPIAGVDKEQAHLLEFKTLNDNSYKDLDRKGLAASKPVYYTQVQICMHLAELEACLFLAVDKNNDEIYSERIEYSPESAAVQMERAERAIFTPNPPDKIGGPAWYECKMCPMYNACHSGIVPDTNCRTCCHSTPLADGSWRCEYHNRPITREEQEVGCGHHIYHPHLIDAEMADASTNRIVYRDRNGSLLANGAHEPVSDSDEIMIFDSRQMEGRHIDTICNHRIRETTALADKPWR